MGEQIFSYRFYFTAKNAFGVESERQAQCNYDVDARRFLGATSKVQIKVI